MEGSGCYGGKCYCRPRLLYSPSAGACMQCSTFGTTFSVYPDLGVKGNNDVRFYQVAGPEDCKRRCLTMKEGLCRSIEYTETRAFMLSVNIGKTCYASFASLEAMRKGDLIEPDGEWTLILRDCQ
ncbi:uncharacterized protein LOC124257267 [Haliotis rubra]|uniref:uncharacterized protein LOC124257267 n=1 Tax=Haliotis rubra TaxID=36100 RepID=UPI001EE60535|nr:uncharacterized protein LOC124257267 [Haliotis rubra]